MIISRGASKRAPGPNFLGSEKMRTKATKKIMGVGHSLTVNVTKEVKAMGLSRGDYVNVTLEPVDDHPRKGKCIDCKNWEVRKWDLGQTNWCKYADSEIVAPITDDGACMGFTPKTDD